jgi:protein gp37
MAETTKIEWCDHTFNAWIGCTKVSPACDNCYAEAQMATRLKRVEWGPHGARRRTKTWNDPLKWNRKAEKEGVRRTVFCNSAADVFDNHRSIPDSWRSDLWRLIRRTPWLDWLLLTKRTQNIRRYLPNDWRQGYPNVWLGTTVENQAEAVRRIPSLLAIPARVRFLSCEPLLGPIRLDDIERPMPVGTHVFSALECDVDPADDPWGGATISWVIAGGESGPRARPIHRGWVRSLRDQCQEAGTAFFFKQWGEFHPARGASAGDVCVWPDGSTGSGNANDKGGTGCEMVRVGRKEAGRLLDGVEWNGKPDVTDAPKQERSG